MESWPEEGRPGLSYHYRCNESLLNPSLCGSEAAEATGLGRLGLTMAVPVDGLVTSSP